MKICEVLVVALVGLLTVTQYSLPAPIFPIEMKRRHLGQTSIGVALAAYSFGFILGSIMPTDRLYKKLGRRSATQCGILVLSCALVLYATSYFIPDQYRVLFLFASIACRMLEGFSTGIILSALLTLLSLAYPSERGRALSARACGGSLGMSLGGLLGGCLNMVLGYFGVFLAFSVVTLLTSLLIFIFKDVRSDALLRKKQGGLSLLKFLSVRRSVLSLGCNAVSDFLQMALEPTLAIKLKTDFGFSSSEIGLYFLLFFGGGALTMISMIAAPE